jgi:hypothetical protein
MWIRAIKITLLASALLLSACSMIRVAYSNGETLSYWWLNSYIDVESEQKPWIKTRINHLFEWHRKTQLAAYVEFLKLGQRQLQQPIDKPTVLNDIAELKKRTAIMIDHALPDLTDLALDLRPQQIAEIEKKYASGNSDYRKNYLRGELAQRQQYRFKKVMDQAEFWFGDFTREQESVIRKTFDAVLIDNDRHYAQRLRRQHELLDVLKKILNERPRREVAMALLREQTSAMLESPANSESSAYYTTYYDGMTNVAVTVINTATAAQRAHASRKLQEFIDDFSRLGR